MMDGSGPRLKGRAVLLGLLAVAVLGATAGCTRGPPRAGDRVVPKTYGAGGVSDENYPVVVSLYQYSSKTRFTITGKSITFKIPISFLAFTANWEGGAQDMIHITVDLNNFGPLGSPHRPGLKLRSPESPDRDLDLTLHSGLYAPNPNPRTRRDIEANNLGPELSLSGNKLELAPIQYCGQEVFWDANPASRSNHSSRNPPSKLWPFRPDVLLANPREDGSFYPLTHCDDFFLPNGFPRCATVVTYRGWPMTLDYSAKHLCEIDNILKKSINLLDRYVVSETQRPDQARTSRTARP